MRLARTALAAAVVGSILALPFATGVVSGDGQSGTTLTASTTTALANTTTYGWTIDKSVSPDAWDLFTGDSGTSTYTIAVTKDAGTTVATMSGQVCVTNGGAVATENLAIMLSAQTPPGAGGAVVASLAVDLSANPVLDSGESHCYPYQLTIPSPVVGATYKATADVTITNHSGHLGTQFGPSPSATAVMPAATVVNDSINVDDTNGGTWAFSAGGSVTYTRTFTCANEGTNDNTATIRQTGQHDGASVQVRCYDLAVSKDVMTTFDRDWTWTIEKSADQSDLTLSIGQSFVVNYTVTVSGTATDSNFQVHDGLDGIQVHNPAPMAATINSVSDVISPAITATVDCGVTFPYTLAAGATMICTYDASVPDASARTNTATAVLQNHAYPGGTSTGTTSYTGTAAVDFATAIITETDECIDVTDGLAGTLGTVCAAPGATSATQTFRYTSTVGPYTECGTYEHINVASFLTGDADVADSDTWTIDVNVPCAGCTLTIGYWKTHAGFTGNNADMVTQHLPIWLGTSGGAKSVQVTTATQAVSLLSMSGGASNGIVKLYAQLLAAKLNIANGASAAAVSATIGQVDAFLATHNAGDWAALTKADKAKTLGWMTTLDGYNNGLLGPGHCSM